MASHQCVRGKLGSIPRVFRSCPIAWSRTTQELLRAAGVRSRLDVYEGEQHAFGPQWPESMRRTVVFVRRQLRA